MDAKIISAEEIPEGDGARVKRLFPNSKYDLHHDPFVLMDEFFIQPPNQFSSHEHRGFEALTYMIEGHFIHEDNQGHKAKVGPGGVQAFNAGKSIVHSEKPGSEGLSHGIQLWVNLPQDKKKSEPEYQNIKANQIPRTETDELIIKTIVGDDSPVNMYTEINYFEIKAWGNTDYSYNLDNNHSGIVYLLNGNIKGDFKLKPGTGILLEQGKNINLKIEENSHFFLLTGVPHEHEIKIKGTFVE